MFTMCWQCASIVFTKFTCFWRWLPCFWRWLHLLLTTCYYFCLTMFDDIFSYVDLKYGSASCKPPRWWAHPKFRSPTWIAVYYAELEMNALNDNELTTVPAVPSLQPRIVPNVKARTSPRHIHDMDTDTHLLTNIHIYIYIYGNVPVIAMTGNIPMHIGQPPWSKHGPNMARTWPKHSPRLVQIRPKHGSNVATTAQT
jgi:hypothetical protein